MELIDGAADAILRLKLAGHRILVVSSQSCVGYGYVTEPVVDSVMDRVCCSPALRFPPHFSILTRSALTWPALTWPPLIQPPLTRIRGSATILLTSRT